MLFSRSIRCPRDRFTKPDLFFSTKRNVSFLLPFVYRGIRWQMFFKISVLKKFQRKISVLESNFSTVVSLICCNFIKKRLQQRCFPVKFAIFLIKPFFTEYFRWLLLRLSGRPMPSKHSSWWRCLEDVLKAPFVFVFRWRLQDVFKTSWSRRIHSPYSYVFRRHLQDVFKTFWSRPMYSSWSYVFKTCSRRVQDVFKRIEDVLPRRLEDVFKTSSRRLAKTSSRRLAKNPLKHLQYVLKTF